jgi:ParB family chromosome partitioning protein
MSKRKDQLGKGIRALLRDMDPADGQAQAPRAMAGVNEIALHQIEVNPFQPRADFDEQALSELSDSIRIHGVIQPITVRRVSAGKFQLISGERRLRASKMAGLKSIPAYVRNANDQEMLEIALIENIQREDLNAMEIAINYQRLLDECDLKHEELAIRVGKNRSTITNYLRLLKLAPDIQKGIKSQKISMGHARALLGLEDPIAQLQLYKAILAQGMSVRQVEAEAGKFKGKKKKSSKSKDKQAPSPEIRRLQDRVSSALSTRVEIKHGSTGKGEILIRYHSDEDLYRIIEMLE